MSTGDNRGFAAPVTVIQTDVGAAIVIIAEIDDAQVTLAAVATPERNSPFGDFVIAPLRCWLKRQVCELALGSYEYGPRRIAVREFDVEYIRAIRSDTLIGN